MPPGLSSSMDGFLYSSTSYPPALSSTKIKNSFSPILLVLMTTQIYLVRVRTSGDEIQKEDWMKGIKWFPFNEALELIEYEDIAKLMLKAKTRIRQENL